MSRKEILFSYGIGVLGPCKFGAARVLGEHLPESEANKKEKKDQRERDRESHRQRQTETERGEA